MNEGREVRETVSRAYGEAVSGSGGCCCGGRDPKSMVTLYAGYGAEELESMPREAAGNAFGCGNPVAFVGLREGEMVLDLGSGAGIDLFLAARRVGPIGRVIGVDMTDEMIAKARENIAASGFRNVEVRKGIIEALPVESDSVDWVISNCVINLSPEKDRVFAEIFRVLKPGGRMLVSDIVAEELPRWVREDEGLFTSCVGGAISEEEYLEGLRRAGLREAEVRERFVYDAEQLAGFCCGESGCCGPAVPEGDASRGEVLSGRSISSISGRVWSALIHARKPTG